MFSERRVHAFKSGDSCPRFVTPPEDEFLESLRGTVRPIWAGYFGNVATRTQELLERTFGGWVASRRKENLEIILEEAWCGGLMFEEMKTSEAFEEFILLRFFKPLNSLRCYS